MNPEAVMSTPVVSKSFVCEFCKESIKGTNVSRHMIRRCEVIKHLRKNLSAKASTMAVPVETTATPVLKRPAQAVQAADSDDESLEHSKRMKLCSETESEESDNMEAAWDNSCYSTPKSENSETSNLVKSKGFCAPSISEFAPINRISWSTEENRFLYSMALKHGCKWKYILALGKGIFHSSRTAKRLQSHFLKLKDRVNQLL